MIQITPTLLMVNVQRWITQFISKQSWQENDERYLKMGPQNGFQVGHDSAHSDAL